MNKKLTSHLLMFIAFGMTSIAFQLIGVEDKEAYIILWVSHLVAQLGLALLNYLNDDSNF